MPDETHQFLMTSTGIARHGRIVLVDNRSVLLDRTAKQQLPSPHRPY
jgi:sRNA-binding regulator protein Hfq